MSGKKISDSPKQYCDVEDPSSLELVKMFYFNKATNTLRFVQDDSTTVDAPLEKVVIPYSKANGDSISGIGVRFLIDENQVLLTTGVTPTKLRANHFFVKTVGDDSGTGTATLFVDVAEDGSKIQFARELNSLLSFDSGEVVINITCVDGGGVYTPQVSVEQN